MDKQTAEPKPKKQEETLSFCGVAISVKYAEQDDPHGKGAQRRPFLLREASAFLSWTLQKHLQKLIFLAIYDIIIL